MIWLPTCCNILANLSIIIKCKVYTLYIYTRVELIGCYAGQVWQCVTNRLLKMFLIFAFTYIYQKVMVNAIIEKKDYNISYFYSKYYIYVDTERYKVHICKHAKIINVNFCHADSKWKLTCQPAIKSNTLISDIVLQH